MEAALVSDVVSSAESSKTKPVYKIVLTGGPCAGKTTALDRLSAFLRERGFRVFTVPEAATMLFSNGVFFSDLATVESQINFQGNLMGVQIHLEDTFSSLASKTGETCVVICDRGACDGKAYMSTEGWSSVLTARGLDSDVPLREGRYNAVFHLVTAANGAEKFYTLANNGTRTESAAQARDVDVKTQEAWMGHPQHFVFDNENVNFEGKLCLVVDTMAKIVGLPLVKRTATKFMLEDDSVAGPALEDAFAVRLRENLKGDGALAAEPLQVTTLTPPLIALLLGPLLLGLQTRFSAAYPALVSRPGFRGGEDLRFGRWRSGLGPKQPRQSGISERGKAGCAFHRRRQG
jgi:predicted ATPase